MSMGEQELVALAEAERIVDAYIDELSVDQSGHCRWADVADALTHIRGELRAAASPRSAGREEIARIIDPVAFSGNEQQRHLHCSPLKVEVVQKRVRSKADDILALLGPAPSESVGWQPIERAPKDGTNVLLYAEVWEMSWGIQIGHFADGEWHTAEGSVAENEPDFDPHEEIGGDDEEIDFDQNFGPTHWRELPAPPTSHASSDRGGEEL